MKRLLLVSDAWFPQVSGVSRTMQELARHARARGVHVRVVHPGRFLTVPCPTEATLRLSAFPYPKMAAILDRFQPHAVHLATEGPLGLAARQACQRRGMPFTASYCTDFPAYLNRRLRIPTEWTYASVRWFHKAAARTFVATPRVRRELMAQGFERLELVPRGVDREAFFPGGPVPAELAGLPRPWFLNVGRVAAEKNLEAFLALDLPGTKLVVGDGPERERLAARHPQAVFLGTRRGEELRRTYAAADVFVFPSVTDTFGLVMLEALACGTPVATFRSDAPLEVIGDDPAGVLREDLREACLGALEVDEATCLRHAARFDWPAVGDRFLDLLAWTAHDDPRAIA